MIRHCTNCKFRQLDKKDPTFKPIIMCQWFKYPLYIDYGNSITCSNYTFGIADNNDLKEEENG